MLEFFIPEGLTVERGLDDKKNKDEDKDKKETKDDEVKVTIDFQRLTERRHPAFALEADNSYPVLTPDNEKYLFIAFVLLFFVFSSSIEVLMFTSSTFIVVSYCVV